MSRRLWPRAAAVAGFLITLAAFAQGNPSEVRDGQKFNPAASGQRLYIRRTVDSTEASGFVHQAGRVDSAVIVYPPQVLPVPMLAGGVYRSDTSSRAFHTDNDGTLYTLEEFPLSDQNFIFQNIITDCATCSHLALSYDGTGLLGTSADSSAILDTHRMRLGTLLLDLGIEYTTAVDTTTEIALIVQVRTHLSATASDSAGTFPLYMYGQNGLGASAAAIDTAAFGHLQIGSAGTPWSGEFTVYYSAKRRGVYNQWDLNGRSFYFPGTIAIPLSSIWGRDVYSPYTSVRIRDAGVRLSGGLQTTRKLKAIVHLVGTPL